MQSFLPILIERLWATGLQTAVLTALVWALCRALPRLPAASQCWLWWLVALQAVLGLFAPALELRWLPAPDAATATTLAAAAAGPAGMAPPALLAADPPSPAGTALPLWMLALAAGWIAGVGLMAWITLRDWHAARRLVRDAWPCTDLALTDALALAAEAHGLRRAPVVKVSAAISSPQLVGPWRPVLLLPADATLDADELDLALTHELQHLRRGDLGWGLLPALARHLFFFHPCVHLAVREYGIAREAACDAAVVAQNVGCRHDYGRLLLRLGVAPSRRTCLASASPTFLSLKRRLTMLQNTSCFPRLASAVLVATVAVGGVLPLRLVAAEADVASAHERDHGSLRNAGTTSIVHGRLSLSGTSADEAYVRILDRQKAVMDGSLDDLEDARRASAGGQVLWVRRGDARYVIRDAATLARFDAIQEPVRRLAEQQGDLGERQGKLGEQMGRMGREQGELGRRDAERALEQARRALAGEASTPAPHDRDGASARRQQELGDRMEALSGKMEVLGREQEGLSLKMEAAHRQANLQTRQLLDQAIAGGLTTSVAD